MPACQRDISALSNEDLDIKVERVGPLYMMVDRQDSKRLRDAIKRLAKRRR